MSRTNFNMIFPGSTRSEFLAEQMTRIANEAQAEGFTSKEELQTAIGQAQERAKQMGQPGKQLIGPVQSPFQGKKYEPSKEEVQVADTLVKNRIQAVHSGDAKKVAKASSALQEHETTIKRKAKDHQQKFVPKNTKEQLAKQIKTSRELRKV